jgi:hypothetical protein
MRGMTLESLVWARIFAGDGGPGADRESGGVTSRRSVLGSVGGVFSD